MDQKDAHLEYVPAPLKPTNFDKEVLEIVGVCPNNIDPNIRFVWAMDSIEHYGTESVHKYPDPDGKYVGLPFWVIEGWQSPDVYDRAEWESNKDVLGDFPANGVWDFLEVYRTPTYKFMPLGRSAIQKALEWKFWKSQGDTRSIKEILDRRARISELKEKRFTEAKNKIYNEYLAAYSGAAAKPVDTAYSFPKHSDPNFRRLSSGLLVPNSLKNANN